MLSLVLVLLAFLSITAPSFVDAHTRVLPRQSNETACYQIFGQCDFELFPAKLAYDCLITAPFNATVAAKFLDYYKGVLEFHTTLTYLKDPPASYQQPSIDVLGALAALENEVNKGTFTTEYDFEVALQRIIYAIHDTHVALSGGLLSIFTFGSLLRFVAASSNGIALPKIYIPDDILEAQNEDWTPSAVASVNGEDIVDFLTRFAASNAAGGLEPHADWNQMMSNPAGDVQGLLSAFEGSSIFYPGESFEIVFENGTKLDDLPWIAGWTSNVYVDTPAIASGNDLYNYFVLGDLLDIGPPSCAVSAISTDFSDTSSDGKTSTVVAPTTVIPSLASSSTPTVEVSASTTTSAWYMSSYPTDPVVAQPNLGSEYGGYVTGYFLNDGVTTVLSIPSFQVAGEGVLSFSPTIGNFIARSKLAGRSRIIIDLQRNQGGSALLATDAFKQFFPSIDPFGGARLRAHPAADTLGNTFTNYFVTRPNNSSYTTYAQLAADAWVAPVYLNAATGRNFSSWPEFFGPHPDHADQFTTTQRNNLSSIIFDQSATQDDATSVGIVVYGYGNRSATSSQPYAAEDIILLTDAYCASACASFVEMMHHEAGVRTVVAGGRPDRTPMQHAGGSRGAFEYTAYALEGDAEAAQNFNGSVVQTINSSDVEFLVNFASLNLKDSIREGEDFPLQFSYEPADCRIFYTLNTVYNFENLWNYVVDAIWRNPSLCIAGAANSTAQVSRTNTTGPSLQPSQTVPTSTSSGVADAIMQAFQHSDARSKLKARSPLIPRSAPRKNKGQPRSRPRREITALEPRRYPSHHRLSTFAFAGNRQTTGACSSCPSDTFSLQCSAVDQCVRLSNGNYELAARQDCKRGCYSSSDCIGNEICHYPQSGNNAYCQTLKENAAIQSCRTSTKVRRSQETEAVHGGYHGSYARGGFRRGGGRR